MASPVLAISPYRLQWGQDSERSITGFHTSAGYSAKVINVKEIAAEFVGTFLLVAFGCGAATSHGWFDAESRLVVAFAFSMTTMVILYATGHHSGGQSNCAITFSLVLGKHMPWYQGLANALSQLIASILGACLVAIMFPCNRDSTTTLGSNMVHPLYDPLRVLCAEAFGTFLVCLIVWETAVTPKTGSGKNSCLAIGFSVFVVHLMLLPISNCSINPTRSFGPAMVSHARSCDNYTEGAIRDLWIMWIGPLFGAALAAGCQRIFAPNTAQLKVMEAAVQESLRAQQLLEAPMEIDVNDEKPRDNFDNIMCSEKPAPAYRHDAVESAQTHSFATCLGIF